MALSPVYAAILQDLNKAVAHGQPEDVLQFCANWFNAKLEEQRIAGRLSIAQAEGAMGSLHTGARSKSLAPIPSPSAFPPQLQQQHHQQQPSHPALKKKASLPSLAGQGYTFGSGAAAAINGNGKPAYYDAVHPSPFSETPPSRGGGSHNNNGYHHPSASSSSRIAGAAVPSGSPSTGGIMWNRPFPAMHGGSGPRGAGGDAAGGPADIDMQHEDEEDAAARLSEGRDRLGAISPGNRNGGSGGLPPLSSSASPSAADNGIPQGYNLGRRTSVSAESIDPNSLSNSAHSIPKVIIPKTPSQRARIESSTEKNLLFRNLDEEQHNDVVNAMKEVQVTQGTEVIVQGAVGDFFYVVESGDFQIWVKPQSSSGMVLSPTLPSSSNNNARGRSVSVEPEGSMKEDMQATTTLEDGSTVRADGSKLVATITSGGSFGELALMYNAPRAATVVCSSENATLWALDRVTFRTILMEHTSKKRRMYEQFLSEVPILVSLEGYERSKIADALEERIYEEGEDVVREGELGKNFYIIESGKAEVLKRKEGGKQERVGTLTKGDYFGELALLNSAPRAATVRAVSGRLRVATLGEKAFTRLLGPVVEILTRSAVTKYGASSVASGESSRGGNVNSSSSAKDNNSHSRLERERSGTSTPTTAAGREREKE